jgi:hypothetical protein
MSHCEFGADQFDSAEQYCATLFHEIATDRGAIWLRIAIATDFRIVISTPLSSLSLPFTFQHPVY